MNSIDEDFLKQIKVICDKNNINFDELDFTISKLTEWIIGFYKFQKTDTAKKKAITLHDGGFLTATTKGFRFSEKALKVVEL